MFALAGAIAALGPVIIHLLNRRRYRVVEWAAMDFLREALQRNRRILHLRDLLLLAIRTACVLLFGFALSRPFFAATSSATTSQGPVHAVVVLDNSLSMGYERLDGTLLDEARRKAEDFIEQLPQGSRISVIPLCGSEQAYALDPYRTRDDAREALKKIKPVDRAGTAPQAIDLAADACRLAPDLPTKRVVFIGDQQVVAWPSGSLEEQLKQIPELQIVHIAAETPENAWISEFRIQDGIADIETAATFLAVVRYEGPARRSNVQVTLEVDGAAVASRTVDLEPGQFREIQFPYRFDVPVEPGRAHFVPAMVKIEADSIEGDRLPADNQRFLDVPVVAALPVVFVDQLGERENPARNDFGETFRLRRMLVPIASRGDAQRQLVQIRHTTIDKLDKSMLENARLVVIAGVANPEGTVPLLREYVNQGGRLFIAAGAKFDPKVWSEEGWRDGQGILPAPLRPEAVGQLPEEATSQLKPFQLNVKSLVHEYFRPEDSSSQDLDDLYHDPLFFKAVAVEMPQQTEWVQQQAARLGEDRKFLEESDQRLQKWAHMEAQHALSEADREARTRDEEHRADLEPHWLLWADQIGSELRQDSPEKLAERSMPRVLGAFDRDQLPFLVERNIGRGQVVFVSTGVYSDWNDLTKTNAALMFDRMFRTLLEQTLPRYNRESTEQITLPVETGNRRIHYTLTRPSGVVESLSLDALGPDAYGVTVRNVMQAGHYVVSAVQAEESDAEGREAKLWEIPLAVNGPPDESQLQSVTAADLAKRMGGANYRWLERDESISLAGAQIRGQNLWKILMALVLVGLLAEIFILAWPAAVRGRTA